MLDGAVPPRAFPLLCDPPLSGPLDRLVDGVAGEEQIEVGPVVARSKTSPLGTSRPGMMALPRCRRLCGSPQDSSGAPGTCGTERTRPRDFRRVDGLELAVVPESDVLRNFLCIPAALRVVVERVALYLGNGSEILRPAAPGLVSQGDDPSASAGRRLNRPSATTT